MWRELFSSFFRGYSLMILVITYGRLLWVITLAAFLYSLKASAFMFIPSASAVARAVIANASASPCVTFCEYLAMPCYIVVWILGITPSTLLCEYSALTCNYISTWSTVQHPETITIRSNSSREFKSNVSLIPNEKAPSTPEHRPQPPPRELFSCERLLPGSKNKQIFLVHFLKNYSNAFWFQQNPPQITCILYFSASAGARTLDVNSACLLAVSWG